MVRYHHKQAAAVILVSLLLGGGLCISLGFILPPQVRWVAALGALFIVFAVLFGSLTVEVGESSLTWWFGPGLIHREVPLSSIVRAEVTETAFVEGWGIHLTRRGWLYNVSGYGAVLILQTDGKSFLIGSDEPEALAEAINSARR